jgi:antirestriction protein ArdC
MKKNRTEIQQEALSRASNPIGSLTNYPEIIRGFTARGIPEAEILPRQNVFTYQAWRALGRQVRRGEHGVKVITYVPTTEKTGEIDPETGIEKTRGGKRPWTATVFHVSQTDPTTSYPLKAKIRELEEMEART